MRRFFLWVCRRLQFLLAPDPVEKDPHAIAHGDCPSIPLAFVTVRQPDFTGRSPFGRSCAGSATDAPGAFVSSFHDERSKL